MTDKWLNRPDGMDSLADALPSIDRALDRRINADPENLERGLAQLVLTIVELLRQLMERQALRRMDDGSYGSCELCGAPIELERLEVLPQTAHCLTCQSGTP